MYTQASNTRMYEHIDKSKNKIHKHTHTCSARRNTHIHTSNAKVEETKTKTKYTRTPNAQNTLNARKDTVGPTIIEKTKN